MLVFYVETSVVFLSYFSYLTLLRSDGSRVAITGNSYLSTSNDVWRIICLIRINSILELNTLVLIPPVKLTSILTGFRHSRISTSEYNSRMYFNKIH